MSVKVEIVTIKRGPCVPNTEAAAIQAMGDQVYIRTARLTGKNID
jgi:hypothetical protein